MNDYGPATYGDRIADVYDDLPGVPGDTDAAVAFLAELAGSGRVLELGIGTGRVALPLAARGVEVVGIDASPAMVARLQAKPGGQAIPVVLGDLADVDAAGPFTLAYVVFNTFFALLDQAEQIRVGDPGAGRRAAPDGAGRGRRWARAPQREPEAARSSSQKGLGNHRAERYGAAASGRTTWRTLLQVTVGSDAPRVVLGARWKQGGA